MRIHTDHLTNRHLIDAANTARVEFDRFERKGSRSRDHAFDITLTGESRRRPNNGISHQTKGTDDYAATWDQWGVFLAILFDLDPEMVTPYYTDAEDFFYKTDGRFDARATDPEAPFSYSTHWPADAHGDHVFRFTGTPFEQSCTKCSAVQRWGPLR